MKIVEPERQWYEVRFTIGKPLSGVAELQSQNERTARQEMYQLLNNEKSIITSIKELNENSITKSISRKRRINF